MPWPGVTIRTSVSLDTSEIKGKCRAEKGMGIEAWEFVGAAL